MIKIENVEVVGWEAAIRGMRNPMNSWDKSDSEWCPNGTGYGACYFDHRSICVHRGDDECIEKCEPKFYIGQNDHSLMMNLRNAGTDHRKFMRMITVYVDITAPLYWWKEHDQYKVGTTTNSCSTMHKIADKEFAREDFSHEHLGKDVMVNGENLNISLDCLDQTVRLLNTARQWYLETKDKKYWWQMIQLLPSSYNQKRTVMLNYEVLANIYESRKNHKLDEWVEFCQWIKTLPYAEIITAE